MLHMQDGSAESFQELLEAIMSPSSLLEFDTNIFQAALVGEGPGGGLCASTHVTSILATLRVPQSWTS